MFQRHNQNRSSTKYRKSKCVYLIDKHYKLITKKNADIIKILKTIITVSKPIHKPSKYGEKKCNRKLYLSQ